MRKKHFHNIFFLVLFLSLLLPVASIQKVDVHAAALPVSERNQLIWFGDSRTVGFAMAVYGYTPTKKSHPRTMYKKHVVARDATVLSWAQGTGYRQLCKRLKKRPAATVVFNFGVNDIGRGYSNHVYGYLNLIKKIHKKYPKAHICFMTVNPVKGSSRNPYARTGARAATLNRKIASFNSYMRKHLPKACTYINTNKNVRFSYKDGLHYTNGGYRRIAKYVTGKRRLTK